MKTRAVEVNSTVLTCYVMGLGALLFLLGGLFYDEGVRLETNVITWLYIGGDVYKRQLLHGTHH